MGNGSGNFTSQTISLIPQAQEVTEPNGILVATGDINGDGVPDLVIPDISNTFVVLGRLDRNFPSPASLRANTGNGMAIADVNGDGFPDLFVAGALSGTVPGTTFLGRGDGTFQGGANAPAGGLFVADVNGDGLADLIGTDGTNILIWPGTADPSFSSSPIAIGAMPASLLSSFPTIRVADMDGDGQADIVVAGTIYFGRGNFQFESVQVPFGNLFVIGDFNNDGKLDIMAGTTFLNQGNRTFASVPSAANLGEIPVSLIVGDFNEDGVLDVASLDSDLNVVLVNYGRGDGTFLLQEEINFSDPLANAIAVGDFNGDGWPDLIVGFRSSSRIALLTNDNRGGFLLSYFAGSGTNPTSLATSDFNEDGKPDVAVLSGSGNALVMLEKK